MVNGLLDIPEEDPFEEMEAYGRLHAILAVISTLNKTVDANSGNSEIVELCQSEILAMLKDLSAARQTEISNNSQGKYVN